MNNSKRYFNGGVNNDDSLNLFDEGDYLNLLNGRVSISEFGKSERVENISGTTAITNQKYPPYGTQQTIGSCIDIEGKRLLWFVANTFNDDGIYCYDFTTQQIYAVLYSSQIAGGLNFSKSYRVNRNCKVNQGLLYWTDNNNEPKKINIDSGIKLNQPGYVSSAQAYTSLTDSYEITLIRRPIIYAPAITKTYDATYTNNFIATNSWLFAWQYIYFDGEISVLGEFSTASKLNTNQLGIADNYNYIACALSLNETIPQTVRIIRLVTKNQSTSVTNVIKTYDKLVSTTPFTNHNSGIQLVFNYYGDIVGETIGSVMASTPYHSVPIRSVTVESAVNRIMLGNNLSGYDTPISTSLQITQTIGNISGVPFVITRTDTQTGVSPTITGSYFLNMSGSPQIGDIVKFVIAVYDTNRTPVNSSVTLTYTVGSTNILTEEAGIRALIQGNAVIANYEITATDQTVPNLATKLTTTTGTSKVLYVNVTITYINPATTNNTILKDESSYQSGIVFYDKARRKCGVVTNSSCLASTPTKTYANNSGALTLNWTLNNNAPTIEIPNWAYYYSIVRTLNLKTRYFIDALASNCFYANKNSTTGIYEYTIVVFNSSVVAIALDSTALLQANLGYVYSAGDICVIISSIGTRYEQPVMGVDGKYILIKPIDIGSLTGASFIYEIYTPYIRSDVEPYYEVGNMYKVTNPTLPNRTYGTLSGTLSGDVFIIQRAFSGTNYYVEAMSPNDAFYQTWYTDAGFVNYVTLLGQVQNSHEIRYSDVYTPGTQNNGLSSFQALNFKTIPLGTGAIQKLQLASKTEEQGVIMLSIGTFQTASCYLGEVQVIGASANAFLAQDTSVIGTINVLKGMFGTTAPETVIEYLGLVFWYDLNNGCFVQYSSNGLSPISSFKMTNFFQKYAKNYLTASTGNLDNINGFHHIPTQINPLTKRVQVTTPGLIYANYAATLPSYSSVPSYATNINNYFDAYTQLAQTVCFDILENRWKETFEFAGEWYDYFENIMIGWKNGVIYTHETNNSALNTFYGIQCPLRICFTPNVPPSAVKDILDISIEGNAIPDFTVLYSTFPWTQISDLDGVTIKPDGTTDYRSEEGVQYARFFRDRISPNVSGTADQKLYSGDIIQGQTPQIMVEFKQYTTFIYINAINVGWALSKGQQKIVK